jgi:hypothetical protein
MRRPDTCRLDLTRGDWLLVKKWLTAGETRDIFARTVKTLKAGDRAELEPRQLGITQAAVYLVDWTFQDADGKPLVIRDQPVEVIVEMLNDLDAPDLAEVLTAIYEHDARMEAEREVQKKTAGAPASSPTSESPA